MESAANNSAAALQDLDLEMETLLQVLGPPFNKPHQLIRQGDDLLVAIASVKELDAALAAAPAVSLEGVVVLRGYVLPMASIKDCLLLKAAAEAGWYGCFKFRLADHGVVDAKISARASVDQARAQLGDVVSMLDSLKGDFTAGTGAGSTGTGAAPPWVAMATVESAIRSEVQQHMESTIAHIKALSERLDSI